MFAHAVDGLAVFTIMFGLWLTWRKGRYVLLPEYRVSNWWVVAIGVGGAALLLGLRDLAHALDLLVQLVNIKIFG